MFTFHFYLEGRREGVSLTLPRREREGGKGTEGGRLVQVMLHSAQKGGEGKRTGEIKVDFGTDRDAPRSLGR